MSTIFHYKNCEIAFFPYETSLKIRLLDAKNARCFESDFSDSQAKILSKSLCLDSKDLFSLIKRAISSQNELINLEILFFGGFSIRILMQFPIEKLFEFTIPLKELELNEYRKGLYHLQDLEARLLNIETFFTKEQLKIKRNTHFPTFDPVSESNFSFNNKRKCAIRVKTTIIPENELLSAKKLDKTVNNSLELIKFSAIFKGKTPLINGFLGISFGKETVLNKKGCFLLGNNVVYWDDTFFNYGCFIRNNQEISIVISEEKEMIRWENKEGEKIFEGRVSGKRDWGLVRPVMGVVNEGDSMSFL